MPNSRRAWREKRAKERRHPTLVYYEKLMRKEQRKADRLAQEAEDDRIEKEALQREEWAKRKEDEARAAEADVRRPLEPVARHRLDEHEPDAATVGRGNVAEGLRLLPCTDDPPHARRAQCTHPDVLP